MVEFLTTREISARIERIIRDAKEHLVLISPYIKAHRTIKERLEQKIGNGFDIHLVCREKNLRTEEREWLQSMPFMKVSYRESLHAKCYVNEHEALVTSMNLYDYSELHNDEMGLLVSAGPDAGLYNEVVTEVLNLIEVSEEASTEEPQTKPKGRTTSAWTRGKTQARNRPRVTTSIPTDGFCIRCKADIPANPSQPYCRLCYTSWKRFGNKSYEEKYCHIGGCEFASTLLKPLCRDCYRKYKDVFEFATA